MKFARQHLSKRLKLNRSIHLFQRAGRSECILQSAFWAKVRSQFERNKTPFNERHEILPGTDRINGILHLLRYCKHEISSIIIFGRSRDFATVESPLEAIFRSRTSTRALRIFYLDAFPYWPPMCPHSNKVHQWCLIGYGKVSEILEKFAPNYCLMHHFSSIIVSLKNVWNFFINLFILQRKRRFVIMIINGYSSIWLLPIGFRVSLKSFRSSLKFSSLNIEEKERSLKGPKGYKGICVLTM